MVDAKTLIPILRRMEQILRRNDHPGQADYVAAITTIAEWDAGAIVPALASGAMWGGSGAVWEVGELYIAGDRREFWQSLIQLVDAMNGQAINSAAANDRAQILSQWIAKGIG